MLSARPLTSCNRCPMALGFSSSLPEYSACWIRLAERLRVLRGNGIKPKAVSSCATDGMGPMSKIGVGSSIIRELRSGWIFRCNGDHAPGMGCRMGVAGGA